MARMSRSKSRSGARERKAGQRRRMHYRAGLKRKLRAAALAIFLTAITGGLTLEGTSYFSASPADGSMDPIAEVASQELVTIPRQSEEELRARWAQIDELQREIHRGIATELRVSPLVPPLLAAGSSAAEIVPEKVHEIITADQQLELRDAADVDFRRARRQSDEDQANARSATF